MSIDSIVYGAICGPGLRVPDLLSQNAAAINALPAKADLQTTFVSRDIFAVPTVIELPSYRRQVIHFGFSPRNIVRYWDRWLPDFENLLRRMYWTTCYLRMDVETYGEFSYSWQVPTQELIKRIEGTYLPINEWKFEGGPREFPDY